MPAGQFPFLKLPPELRNRVYDLVLPNVDCDGDPISIRLTQHPLTRVNKIIRKETLAMFYSKNNFILEAPALEPAKTDLLEEHRRLRFLRAVRLLVCSGYFDHIRHLDILVFVRGPLFTLGHGIKLEITNDKPTVYNWEEESSQDGPPLVLEDDSYWDLNRVGGGYVDWNSIDDCTFSLEMQKLILSGMALDAGLDAMADDISEMSIHRPAEVLHLLLKGKRNTEKFIFASLAEFHF